MPLTRVNVWNDDQTPTAAEVNAEFANIYSKFSSGITAGDVADDILQTDATSINAADYDTLQEAINEASANNKNVLLPPGTYDADTTPIEVPNNVRLIGAGAGLVTIKPAVGYQHLEFIRLIGSNISIEDVTIEVDNLSITSQFYLVTMQPTEGTHQKLLRCHLKAGTIAIGMQVHLVRIVGSSDTRELLEIQRCLFNGVGNIATYSTTGISIVSARRVRITNCTLVDCTYRAINCTQCWFIIIQENQFTSTLSTYRNAVVVTGAIIFEDNYLSSEGSSANNEVTLYAYSSTVTRVRGNQFNVNPSVSAGSSALTVRGNCSIEDNTGSVGTSGWATGFISIYSNSDSDRIHAVRNTVNNGDVYSTGNHLLTSQMFGKGYADQAPFRMGDVTVWLRFTGGVNYLHFKQTTVPTGPDDYDARVALTGVDNIAD